MGGVFRYEKKLRAGALDFIPVNMPLLDGNEEKYLAQCVATGWISSEGPFVTEFEEKFAARVDRGYGISVTNGTAALDVAFEVLGIEEGDEVIMPTFTIISCLSHLVRIGAKPALVDADPITWNMDISKIEEKITDKTKAILAVHIYGLPVDMDPLLDICRRYKLRLIEDAAEAIGLKYKGRECGSFGDVSTVSFYPNKHITTGEGGMVLTNDAALAEEARSLRNLCFQGHKRFVHERLGWNLRMTNLQAAVGLAQLETLEKKLKRKREIGKLYSQLLDGTVELQTPLDSLGYAENLYWVFGVVLNEGFGLNASQIMSDLGSRGVGSRPFFFPMHKQPVLTKMGLFADECHPVSENLATQGFYLPSGLGLSDHEIYKVSATLKDVLGAR